VQNSGKNKEMKLGPALVFKMRRRWEDWVISHPERWLITVKKIRLSQDRL